MKVITKKRKLRQLFGNRCMTMNTEGELIHTLKITTVYYIFKIPFFWSINYIYGTKKELDELIFIVEKEK